MMHVINVDQLNICTCMQHIQIWPQSEYPLIPVGRMVLNRNPTNYFCEVEQIAFCPAHLVPGIEPSPDKMLQVSHSTSLASFPGSPHRLPLCMSLATSQLDNFTCGEGRSGIDTVLIPALGFPLCMYLCVCVFLFFDDHFLFIFATKQTVIA